MAGDKGERVMEERIVYRCEICGSDFSDRKQAKKCEEGHKTGLVVEKAEYNPCGWVNHGFPRMVILKSKDGKTAIYRTVLNE